MNCGACAASERACMVWTTDDCALTGADGWACLCVGGQWSCWLGQVCPALRERDAGSDAGFHDAE
jgi:hypothetical protein